MFRMCGRLTHAPVADNAPVIAVTMSGAYSAQPYTLFQAWTVAQNQP